MSVGKIIVITGAGMGLGRSLARRFAKDGDTIIALGRTFSKVQALADELGSPHFAVECDIQSPDSVRAAFAKIAERHPKIDVLINNAALYEPFTIAEATDDQIMTAVMTNYVGSIFTCRSAIPMLEKGGIIINVSSESVAEEHPMLSLYESSKAGLERFTQALEHELAADGIRVTIARAGPMWEEGKGSNWDPQVAMRFHQACLAAGIDMRTRPISMVDNVPGIFRALLDLPDDVRIRHVDIGARHR